MSENYLTLTRQSLYDLVWSKPMVEVAKQFSISDRGLAKRCAAVDVPVPPRGYWARVEAGQSPAKTPLPIYRNAPPRAPVAATPRKRGTPAALIREGEEPRVPFSMPPAGSAKPNQEPPAQDAAVLQLRERIAALDYRLRTTIDEMHTVAKWTAVHLNVAKVSRLTWHKAREGPIGTVDTTDACHQRAVSLLDLLVRSCEALGWDFVPLKAPKSDPYSYQSRYVQHLEKPAPVYGCFSVEGELTSLTIDERQRQVPHVLTEYEKRPKVPGHYYSEPRPWDLKYSGELRLKLTEQASGIVCKEWSDGKQTLLHEKTPKVLLAMYEGAQEIKRRRAQHELWEKRRREQEELERQQRRIRDENNRMAKELEQQARSWRLARQLRAYVRQGRTKRPDATAQLLDKQVALWDWADRYIDRLDPLKM
jgi:hypothetical protein